MKRASELLYGVAVEGEQVKLDSIAGQDVVVKGVGFFETELGPSAAVVIEIGDHPRWFLTASGILVKNFEALADQFPFVARFISKLSATGRNYWTME